MVGRARERPDRSSSEGFSLIGEDPLERERLWQKMQRYLAYYGRQGAGMQMISGADIALWDIAGKAFNQPICKRLGAKYRDKVKAYASTLMNAMSNALPPFRPWSTMRPEEVRLPIPTGSRQ